MQILAFTLAAADHRFDLGVTDPKVSQKVVIKALKVLDRTLLLCRLDQAVETNTNA
jgi:hypothetical protein